MKRLWQKGEGSRERPDHMNDAKILLAMILFCLMANLTPGMAQKSDQDLIREQREASNRALRNFDEAANETFMTVEALITTGSGTLLCGTENLRNYLRNNSSQKMYWVRTPDEIKVNAKQGLAWERGTWSGYNEHGEKLMVATMPRNGRRPLGFGLSIRNYLSR
ncbi:MAG: hypothetical protein AB7K37_05950 [Cyclobacteriaceae bacterium]